MNRVGKSSSAPSKRIIKLAKLLARKQFEKMVDKEEEPSLDSLKFFGQLVGGDMGKSIEESLDVDGFVDNHWRDYLTTATILYLDETAGKTNPPSSKASREK